MGIISRIVRQIIVWADCPHCHGTGKIYNPPVGRVRCGGCGGTGKL